MPAPEEFRATATVLGYKATGKMVTLRTGTGPLFVIYVPNATGASLGISEKPAKNAPWVMNPGTPRAHIMFVQKM